MNPDPVAALRAVLAENARIPALEAEIAHLRKHNASAELDAVLDALNEHPASPDMGDLPMADQVRLIVKWWDETEVENYAADDALDELGAPDEGTPAERIRALAAAKDRRIAELEEQLRTINAALDRYHANVGIEPGTMQIGQVLDYAATHYLEREHPTSEVRVPFVERGGAPEPDRPDYLKPYSASLACPKCGCAVWWQFPDWRGPSEEGDAWCYRSRHMHRDTMKPMLGDGACDWTGRVRRCGSMSGLGARIIA